jgi:hypothetical protein
VEILRKGQTMKSVVFSIGLNVGATEPERQLRDTLREIAPLAVRELAMGRAEWEGIPERFVHVAAEIDAGPAQWYASHLARVLSQDAVAILLPLETRWSLVDRTGAVTDGGSIVSYPPLVVRG